MIRSLLTYAILMGLAGCMSPPSQIAALWPHLQPYDEGSDEAQEQLHKVATDSTARQEMLHFVRQVTARRHVGWKDQMRLTLLIGAAEASATTNDSVAICDAIRSGAKHHVFYAYSNVDLSPPYFLCAIEMFRFKTYYADMFNPDGGSIKPHDAVPFQLYEVQQATGQTMPAEYDAWKTWWTTEGHLLRYDTENEKYLQNQ